jgi:hypothetical protein
MAQMRLAEREVCIEKELGFDKHRGDDRDAQKQAEEFVRSRK